MMAMAKGQDTESETSEQLMTSTWILTECLKNVLSYLPARELIKCARVCKQWQKEAQHILKAREQIGWVSFNYKTAHDGGSDHPLGHFGENLDKYIQSAWSVPYYVLMFTELVTHTEFAAGIKKKMHPGKSPNWNRKTEIQETVHLIKRKLPQQCDFLSLQISQAVHVGTYTDIQLGREEEFGGGMTAVFFPKMEGVNIELLNVSLALLGAQANSIQEALGIAQTTNIKCVLLFGVNYINCYSATWLPPILLESFRESHSWEPVIAGGFVDDLLTEGLGYVSGMIFSGPNVHSSSIILDKEVRTKEHVKQRLQKLKKVGLPEKKMIAFMFASEFRDKEFHGQENADSEAFHEVFPNTPLFGFVGTGEIGCDNFACGKADKKREKARKFARPVSTVICLLSFGQAT